MQFSNHGARKEADFLLVLYLWSPISRTWTRLDSFGSCGEDVYSLINVVVLAMLINLMTYVHRELDGAFVDTS
jgi:hypothetical protein